VWECQLRWLLEACSLSCLVDRSVGVPVAVAVGSLFIKLFGGQKCGSASCGGCED